MSCIGIDLHTNCFTACRIWLDNNGKIQTSKNTYYFEDVWNNKQGEKNSSFNRFLESLSIKDYVLIESCTNAFWFHDKIEEKVKACYVYDTNKARREGNKTDKIDSIKLAKKLGFYITMEGTDSDMPTVYVPTQEVRELRGLFSTYNLYKKMKVQIKNRIHSILKQNGICASRKAFDKKDAKDKINELMLSEIWKHQIKTLFDESKYTEDKQKEIKDMIILCGSKIFKDEIEILLSILGFSPFTAIALMADVVEIGRFKNVKKFCSYLRTAPKINASNKKNHLGSINKVSRSTTVTLLTQSIIHLSKAGKHMKDFYASIKVGKSIGKARIALIRKILVSAYYMLKRNKLYYWVDKISYDRKLQEYHRVLNKLEFCNKKDQTLKKSA